MYTQYTQVSLRFRNESYQFLIKYPFPPDVTDDDIVSITNEKFETTIGASEISFTKKNISKEEYHLSTLDKYLFEAIHETRANYYSPRLDAIGPSHPAHHSL